VSAPSPAGPPGGPPPGLSVQVPPPPRSGPRAGRALAAWALLGAGGAARAGSITVTTPRPGFEVLLDGASTGLLTPATLADVPAGAHTVRVVSGCELGEAAVQVPATGSATASLNPQKADGELVIDTSPPEAEVSLDGEPTAGRRLRVACGEHSLRVSHPGFVQEVRRVQVGPAAVVVVPVQLDPQGVGRLSLSLSPARSELYLDGTQIGVGPFPDPYLLPRITAGPHMVELRAAGHLPRTEMLVVEDGAAIDLKIHLEPDPAAAAVVVAPPPPAEAAPAPPAPAAPRGPGPSPRRVAGVSMAVVGVGVGIVGGTRFIASHRAYQDYLAASTSAGSTAGQAAAIRDDEVLPARNLGVTLSTFGTALLAGGLTLALAF